MAVNAGASAAVAALIETYGEAALVEFKKVTGHKTKVSAEKKVAKEAMIILVQNNPSVSLKDLVKILKKVHPDAATTERKASAWNEFFKTEMAKVMAEMPNVSHGERVKEIGRRWRISKATTSSSFLGSGSRTQNESVSAKRTGVSGSDTETQPIRKRATRARKAV